MQALKRLVDVPIKETCRDQELFFAMYKVLMVSCIREFVDANAQTARASQHFIVEDVVFVILGANIWEKFCEHRHELSQVCRQIL